MVLLQWCNLEPSEQGGIAAIRFSAPVRVQTLRIFPADAQPFSQCPDIVSRTAPQTFSLDVYFNAHPVTNPNAKEKPKPSNALVPTSLVYSGGRRDFAVNMSPEYATRLMIVQGDFDCISMGIYGEVVSERPATPNAYEPRPFPSLVSPSLPSSLDPANALDPTQLARALLKDMQPKTAQLELAICLTFCLRPPGSDWDLPDFPLLCRELDEDDPEFDLEAAFNLTSRPAPLDISPETATRFAEKVAKCISYKDRDTSQAYLVSGILCNVASQCPVLAKYLLDTIDLKKVFDASTVDDDTTALRLLYAASNAEIAKRLDEEWFRELIMTIATDPNNKRELRTTAKQLSARIRGWAILEDAFSNTQGDFVAAASMMKEASTENESFGIWLMSMVAHEGLVAKLAENPVLSVPIPHLLSHRASASAPSQDDFVAFVRAYIGVACVMVAYAWADCVPDKSSRLRIFNIIRLWQSVDGYREIVNHLLLLHQMTYRLKCLLDRKEEPPKEEGVIYSSIVEVEHMMSELAKNPRAFLKPHFVKLIFTLKGSNMFITADERTALRSAAYVVEEGFQTAVDEILRPLERPTFENLRILRVALAYMDRELEEDDDMRNVLDDFWHEAGCGLVSALCEALTPVTEELRNRFSTRLPSTTMEQDVLHQLFATADDILRLILRLIPTYCFPSRLLRTLTVDIADLFACADAADMLYTQSSRISAVSQEARRTAIEMARTLANQEPPSPSGKPGAQVVLGVLLDHGLHSVDLDPVHHLLQVFWLLDFVLPAEDCTEEQRTLWTQHVIPTLLHELWAFCHALESENKVHFFRRLVQLDQGLVGVGEWLLAEEVRDVAQAVRALQEDGLSEPKQQVLQDQVSVFFRFLWDVMQASEEGWVIDSLLASEEAPHVFASSLLALFSLDLTPPHLGELAEAFAAGYDVFDNEVRLALVIALWRSLHAEDLTSRLLERRLKRSVSILKTITPSYLDPYRVTSEIGNLILKLAQHSVKADEVAADSLISLLEWMVDTSTTVPRMCELQAVSSDRFISFREYLNASIPPELTERLDAVSGKLVFVSGDIKPILSPPSTTLTDVVRLTLHDLAELLREHTPVPATPPTRALNQDVLGIVTVSPPTLLRSPAATGLTKTYSNNDFRQLRQSSARANTSRLPSMHVDVGVTMAA